MAKPVFSDTPPGLNRLAPPPPPPPGVSKAVQLVWARRIHWLSIINFILVLVLLGLIYGVAERHWLTALISFAPRVPFLFPSLLLLVAACLWSLKSVWLNLCAIVVMLGPVMGGNLQLSAPPSIPLERTPLVVITSNIQWGQGPINKLVAEIKSLRPDVIALQEAGMNFEPIQALFPEWQVVRDGEFWVGSRYPIKVIEKCQTKDFDRYSCLLCEIETPDGKILLCDIHLNTIRHGAMDLHFSSLLGGDDVTKFEAYQASRASEAAEVKQFLKNRKLPLIALGDFNTPPSSNFFQDNWSNMTSAFDAAGTGFGYTSPCNTDSLWPSNSPWLRIDHILCDSHWQIHSCQTGITNGSDHRLLSAVVSQRK